MTKSKDTDLIDLGAASAATKGVSSQFLPDEMLQNRPTAGLTAD